jgi:hypothetical protein
MSPPGFRKVNLRISKTAPESHTRTSKTAVEEKAALAVS